MVDGVHITMLRWFLVFLRVVCSALLCLLYTSDLSMIRKNTLVLLTLVSKYSNRVPAVLFINRDLFHIADMCMQTLGVF